MGKSIKKMQQAKPVGNELFEKIKDDFFMVMRPKIDFEVGVKKGKTDLSKKAKAVEEILNQVFDEIFAMKLMNKEAIEDLKFLISDFLYTSKNREYIPRIISADDLLDEFDDGEPNLWL